MWISRNPKVAEELEQGLKDRELDRVSISTGIFENGVFREIEPVKKWIMELTNRGVKPVIIDTWVNAIKHVCKGELPKGNVIASWGLKHPSKLTLEDAKAFIYEAKTRGIHSRRIRLVLRNFLSSRGIVVKSTDISGELEEDAGQFADLYVSREKVYELLAEIKSMNLVAYQASFFAYKTASRIHATLNADSQFLNYEEHKLTVFEKSSSRKAKKKVIKLLPDDLWLQMPLDRKGLLFPIEESKINEIIRTAMKKVIPEIEPRITRPFHFWRHMYAQHMLRSKNPDGSIQWNTGLVARTGNWSVEALERYYGKADQAIVDDYQRKMALKI